MGGIVGRLLHEFAVTIMLAILVSGIVSVTLTPMLCARILKDERREKHNAFYQWSERSFDALQGAYGRSLRWSMAHKRIILALFAISIAASVVLFDVMPEDFLPADDTGMLTVSIQAANGTSYERMVNYGTKVADIFNADPNVAGAMLRVGSNGAGANGANISIMLKPLSRARAVGRRRRPRASPEGGQHHRHQCFRAKPARNPDRRPLIAVHLPIYTAGHGYRAAGGRFGPADPQASDHAGLRRRQQRFRCKHAFGFGKDRPGPRRHAGRHAGPDRNGDGLRFWRRAGHPHLRQHQSIPGHPGTGAALSAQYRLPQDTLRDGLERHPGAAERRDHHYPEHDSAQRQSFRRRPGCDRFRSIWPRAIRSAMP